MSASSSASTNTSSSSFASSEENDDEENVSQGECIRKRSNFSIIKSFHMIDKKDFNPEILKHYIDNNASPKLSLLLKYIKQLDEKDMKTSGKLYKHLIFTDINTSTYGAKILASALAINGMNMVFHPQGKGFSLHNDEKLMETTGNNFAVLLSKSFYDRSMNNKIRKAILEKFNSRPDNVHGDLIRFIILDQGFKEGIDLFDVKYVHLFEPLTVKADEKQAIGRATRFCGQKGLEFHPRFGWPLYVYIYDVDIPENIRKSYSDANSLFDLYLKYSNIDMRKIIFASELEKATIEASVDHDLTRTIHSFSIEDPSPILKGGSGSLAPNKIMNMINTRKYITKYFMRMRYPPIQLENNCKGGGGAYGNIVNFTPTQDFIRNYFQPDSAYKGILLHHSVGTGKTCTAIATATTSFDNEGYTILWVTRHTLKSDIWKNMFGQVCNVDLQKKIGEGLQLTNKMNSNMKHVSKNWMEPISYKQFSNMLLKKNKIYNEIIARNGSDDPLHKTLLIIDEAHKLYSPTAAKSERPNIEILEKMIQNSYDKSRKDSVRVLLMTATPFTEDGMEMIQLLNLLKQGDKLPRTFEAFSKAFLDNNGKFTNQGLRHFQDKISGYISYLNRSQDARNFSHPVIKNVFAPFSVEKRENDKAIVKSFRQNIKSIRDKHKAVVADCISKCGDNKDCVKNCKNMQNEELIEQQNQLKELIKLHPANKYDGIIYDLKDKIKSMNSKRCISDFKTKIKNAKAENKELKKEKQEKCKELPMKERKACKDKIEEEMNVILKELLQSMDSLLENCNKMKQEIEEYKDEISNQKDLKKGTKENMKEMKVQANLYKSKIKEYVKELKGLKETINREVKKIRKIKDINQRKTAMKSFKTNNISIDRSKDLQKEIKDLRAKISSLNIGIKNKKISDGFVSLSKVSQEYALHKYCKV